MSTIQGPSSSPDELWSALVEAKEQILNLRDEAVGARAAAANHAKEQDDTFHMLDVTTRQLNQLKKALGYRPDDEVDDIVAALKAGRDTPPT